VRPRSSPLPSLGEHGSARLLVLSTDEDYPGAGNYRHMAWVIAMFVSKRASVVDRWIHASRVGWSNNCLSIPLQMLHNLESLIDAVRQLPITSLVQAAGVVEDTIPKRWTLSPLRKALLTLSPGSIGRLMGSDLFSGKAHQTQGLFGHPQSRHGEGQVAVRESGILIERGWSRDDIIDVAQHGLKQRLRRARCSISAPSLLRGMAVFQKKSLFARTYAPADYDSLGADHGPSYRCDVPFVEELEVVVARYGADSFLVAQHWSHADMSVRALREGRIKLHRVG